MIIDYGEELPIGFGLSLAMNESAMEQFSKMTEQQKMSVVQRSKEVGSRREMESLVSKVAKGQWSL